MLLYTTVGTNDLERAGRFYDAILPLIGYGRQKEAQGEIGYGADGDVRCRFWVVEPFNREPATYGNGATIAFEAPDRASVDAAERRNAPRRRGAFLISVASEGFEPPKATPADLQSDPFGRLGNSPSALTTRVVTNRSRPSRIQGRGAPRDHAPARR